MLKAMAKSSTYGYHNSEVASTRACGNRPVQAIYISARVVCRLCGLLRFLTESDPNIEGKHRAMLLTTERRQITCMILG